MAFDAAQILRQTYAAGAEAAQMRESLMAEKPAAAQVQRGELMGTALAAEADPMADLVDSMEELSAQFEEKTLKKMSDRKMGEMQGPRSAFLRAMEAWYNMMPDMPGRGRLEQIAKWLRNAGPDGGRPSAEALLNALGHESTDPSHQFAMLDMLEQMAGEGEQALLDTIRDAKALLMQQKGPDVKAGINLAQEINARATTPEEMQGLRDMYRSEVVGFTKPQDCFRSILAQRGAEGMKDALEFLLAGCGKDLASATPSIEKAALGRILTDLQCVQVLQTVMERLSQLSGRMQIQFGEQCLLNGEQLTGHVLDLTEQSFVTAVAISRLIGECGLAQLLARMDFTRELTAIFRQLSPRLFAKEGDRQRLVDAAQEHLDGLITEENESEEEEGDAA